MLIDYYTRDRVTLDDHVWLVGNDPHFLGKAVAAAGNGDDVAMVAGGAGQGFAQDEDVLRQVRLLDEGVGPDGLHQIIFEDHGFAVLDAVLDQNEQGFKSLGRQRNGAIIAQQEQFVGVEAKRPKLVQLFCFRGHSRTLINPEKF